MKPETKATHTPGPWNLLELATCPRRVLDSKDRLVAQVHNPDKYGDANEIDANARLIAAAPGLLDAAKYFRSLVDADLLDALVRNGNPYNEAIAKAEGK